MSVRLQDGSVVQVEQANLLVSIGACQGERLFSVCFEPVSRPKEAGSAAKTLYRAADSLFPLQKITYAGFDIHSYPSFLRSHAMSKL